MKIPVGARDAILDWFDASGRDLPFREARDPYAVLVSEIMAQQTQIARASAKWSSFLARFPTVDALAGAAPADVLREWRGLGYNRRALNLQRAARVIVAEHGGRIPDEVDALERLPGVGPYTARAVAAIAFGRPVGPVDTNVRRVLGRVVGGPRQPSGRALQAMADAAVPAHRPAGWTHALMDLGATICRAARPLCAECPARHWCRFAAEAPVAAERRSPRPARQPFAATSRWLRGRLMDRLRDAPGDTWIRVVGPVGSHADEAVAQALQQMVSEGMIEVDASDPRCARLPVA